MYFKMHRITLTVFIVSVVTIVVSVFAVLSFWVHAVTCSSMGSRALANMVFVFNHKLDRDHNGIPCETIK